MRFSFTSTTCVLSISLLVTTAAAIAVPRDDHTVSSFSRRDSYDDVVELLARAKNALAPHHPKAYGKTEAKKLPTKSKEQRKDNHRIKQANAEKKRHETHERRQNNLAKHQQLPNGKKAPVKSIVSKEQAVHAKKEKVQAKAKSTQLEAKERLHQRKEAGRMKFEITRTKYHATDNLPGRKDTFNTRGGKSSSFFSSPSRSCKF